MGWETEENEKPQQTALFTGLTPDGDRVVELLRASGKLFILAFDCKRIEIVPIKLL